MMMMNERKKDIVRAIGRMVHMTCLRNACTDVSVLWIGVAVGDLIESVYTFCLLLGIYFGAFDSRPLQVVSIISMILLHVSTIPYRAVAGFSGM